MAKPREAVVRGAATKAHLVRGDQHQPSIIDVYWGWTRGGGGLFVKLAGIFRSGLIFSKNVVP